MTKQKPETSEETFQEGTTPVQAFSTPVVPAGVGTEIGLRQGRPTRRPLGNPCESAEIASPAQAGTQPTAERAASADASPGQTA